MAPDLHIVELGEDAPDAATLATLEIAFFSGDLYPERALPFMGACLHAPKLAWMHCFNAGVDHPVFADLRANGVRLTTSSGASAVPIAHTVVMQLLALTRDAPRWAREQSAGAWNLRDVMDMEGRTVAVVGLGPIGREVARLCAEFGMRVIAVRRTPTGGEQCETWPVARLGELLAIADDVVLVAPLTEETRGMIGAAQLATMKPGAHLVNVGRGELVDEPALIDSLRRGHLGGAALDVFAVEPLPADSPLRAMPNVIITPHSAGSTPLTRHRAALLFADNLGRYVRGDPLVNEVA